MNATYEQLATEYQALRHIQPRDRTDKDRHRLTELTAELRALLATPPHGYTLPTTAADLITHAHAHGWDAWAQWAPDGGTSGGPFVTVHTGRVRSAADGDRWHYQITWHSRDCPPGRVRLFSGLASTPDHPASHDAPSVKDIRAVITANPAPREEASTAPESAA